MGGIRRHDDRLSVAARRDRADVADRSVRGLGEDRRRIAGVAVVDGAGVKGFEQRRPERELDPSYGYALRLEPLLELLARSHDQQDRGLLIADPHLLQRRRRRDGEARRGEA